MRQETPEALCCGGLMMAKLRDITLAAILRETKSQDVSNDVLHVPLLPECGHSSYLFQSGPEKDEGSAEKQIGCIVPR